MDVDHDDLALPKQFVGEDSDAPDNATLVANSSQYHLVVVFIYVTTIQPRLSIEKGSRSAIRPSSAGHNRANLTTCSSLQAAHIGRILSPPTPDPPSHQLYKNRQFPSFYRDLAPRTYSRNLALPSRSRRLAVPKPVQSLEGTAKPVFCRHDYISRPHQAPSDLVWRFKRISARKYEREEVRKAAHSFVRLSKHAREARAYLHRVPRRRSRLMRKHPPGFRGERFRI